MKREILINYFNEIKERTNGNNVNCDDIIDYSNGKSISLNEIENEYYKYLELQDDIDTYIEDNDLDDVIDSDTIKEHFKDKIDTELFELNQAVLEDFVKYMIIKIKKEI